MTVVAAGKHQGELRRVLSESDLDSDQPTIELDTSTGTIFSDLAIGVDVTACPVLHSNQSLCSPGVKLHGSGFIIAPDRAIALGLGRRAGLERHIRLYRNGRDLTSRSRDVLVIDMFGLDESEVRSRFPEVYQHLIEEVRDKVETDKQTGLPKQVGRRWNPRATYRDNWWIFGEPRSELRPALKGLRRYIVTVETAQHRIFVFVDGEVLPDNKLLVFPFADALHLGLMQSRAHLVWFERSKGLLEDRPVYVKTRCFDPFPFPTPDRETAAEIRAIAEELDKHRKDRQAEHPGLTLTDMYNVLEKLRSGAALDDDDRRIKDLGLVLMLKEYHDRLDAAVARAYGWPADLTDEQVLERLVALNAERAEEEKNGKVRWLRPDYQIPRFGSEAEKARWQREQAGERPATDVGIRPAQGVLALPDELTEMMPRGEQAKKPRFPTGDELAETASVMHVLAGASQPMSIATLSQSFSQGRQIEKRVALTLLALARLGHLTSPDGGERFTLRRVG